MLLADWCMTLTERWIRQGTGLWYISRNFLRSFPSGFPFVNQRRVLLRLGGQAERFGKLQNRLESFAANYIQSRQCRTFGLFGATFQLRDVAAG